MSFRFQFLQATSQALFSVDPSLAPSRIPPVFTPLSHIHCETSVATPRPSPVTDIYSRRKPVDEGGTEPATSIVFFNDHYQAETSSSSSDSDIAVLPAVEHIGDAIRSSRGHNYCSGRQHRKIAKRRCRLTTPQPDRLHPALIDSPYPDWIPPTLMHKSLPGLDPYTCPTMAAVNDDDLNPGYGVQGTMEIQLKSTWNVQWAALTIDIRTWRCS
ncbi:hypothetical protein J6590_090743 [Homalodisca vitripennis]|nr:hypothetical protein J6590_089367 [Homalodisca vitripennis]KAG8329250.1 hypothetical protein J6590_090743 [Homalodisca vitripennis]